MKTKHLFTYLLLVIFPLLLSISACKDEDDTPIDDDTMMMLEEPVCNDSLLPLVMAHGFLASGDTYAKQVIRFTANNYCADRLFVYDWNSLDQNADQNVLLDAFIDKVLATTGAEKVNLAGHSAGGSLGYTYLSDSTRAKKVAHYAHIGSNIQEGAAGINNEIPTLNIWSEDDLIITEKGDIEGATNVRQSSADHYEVATNVQTFVEMYKFFTDEAIPTNVELGEESEINIAGRALTFGENMPLASARVEIYEVDPNTGFRINTTADQTFTTDIDGNWGPWEAKAKTTYEFKVQGTGADELPVHYYREGFTRSNLLVYLRTIPPPTSLAGILLAALPQDDEQSLLAIFSSSQAVLYERDALTVNEVDLATETFATATQTSIAFFLYDDQDDRVSSEGSVALFAAFPFLNGVDVFLPTDTIRTNQVTFNNRTINVRNWPSGTEGPVVVVFE